LRPLSYDSLRICRSCASLRVIPPSRVLGSVSFAALIADTAASNINIIGFFMLLSPIGLKGKMLLSRSPVHEQPGGWMNNEPKKRPKTTKQAKNKIRMHCKSGHCKFGLLKQGMEQDNISVLIASAIPLMWDGVAKRIDTRTVRCAA